MIDADMLSFSEARPGDDFVAEHRVRIKPRRGHAEFGVCIMYSQNL